MRGIYFFIINSFWQSYNRPSVHHLSIISKYVLNETIKRAQVKFIYVQVDPDEVSFSKVANKWDEHI